MINTQPNVQPDGLYGVGEASKALGISDQTLYRYTEAGHCKVSVRRTNGRRVWRGSELIKLWRFIY